MARQEGIEPPTHSLEGCCSIQLSYWRFVRDRPAPPKSSCQVGAPGFEPGTSCSQSRRDTRLRYAPHENPTIVGHSNRVNSRTDSATARPMSQRARTEAALLQALDTPSTLQLPSPLQRGEELRECSSAMTHPLLRSNGRVGERHAELGHVEVRVVSEPMGPGRTIDDRPRHLTAHNHRVLSGAPRRGANESRPPVAAPDGAKTIEEQGVVGGVE